jgi:dTDP-4-dehydrorhamnose reductase
MQKILVTGAAGMLGYKVASYFFQNKDLEIYGTGRRNIQTPYNYLQGNLLIEKELDALLNKIQPDIIVHCAANVNLNDCEVNRAGAYQLHVETTKKLAAYNSEKCRFVYISTDSVYDGIKGNHSETDVTNPSNYYALTKLEGERAATSVNEHALILRTNIYGFNQNGNGNSLFEWIYKNLNAQKAITGFSDVYFNPLYTAQLAQLIMHFIDKNVNGVWNVGCKENVSKYEFALLIAEAFKFDKSLVKSGLINEMPAGLKRPKNTTLNIDKLKNAIENSYSIIDGINQLKTDFTQ